MTNSSSPEPVDLTDPAIEPLRLQELAQSHPHLWDEILQHPNVYPGLAQWIHDRQAEAAAEQSTNEPLVNDSTDEVETDHDQSPTSGWVQPSPVEPVQHAEPTQPYSASSPQMSPQASPQAGGFSFEQPQGNSEQYQTQSFQQPSGFAQQSYPQQQQYPQQAQQAFYGQPGQYSAASRGPSKIDLSSRKTWGLFIASGAAFLALFGFFFSPTATPSALGGISHFSTGGWLLMVLLIATLAISVVDLLLPSRWTHYFFAVLGIGTAFALIGRYMTIAGMLSGYAAGFSLVWIIFMAIIILAGTMVYLAPEMSSQSPGTPQHQQSQQPQAQQAQPYQAVPTQPGEQFGQFGGYGQQPGQYPQGGYGQQPGSSPQYGGYYPPQQPGSPQ